MALAEARTLDQTRVRAGVDWYPLLRDVGLPFLASRALIVLVSVAALSGVPRISVNGAWQGGPTVTWIEALSRWDGRWYLSIVQSGYVFHADAETNVAFFPLYPALMWVSSTLLGRLDVNGVLAIGIALSNLFCLAAFCVIYVLVRELRDAALARRTILCLALFPTSFFLSAVYPESLFLLTAAGAFLAAHHRRWALAGVLGALATLTRVYGILIALPLAWMYLSHMRWRPRPSILWLALPGAAAAGWLLYLYVISGDPKVLTDAQVQWGRRLWSPIDMLVHYLSLRYWAELIATGGASMDLRRSPIDLASFVVCVVLLAAVWRMRLRALALYATLLFVPTISFGTLISLPRFALELFPMFIALGHLLRRRAVLGLYLALSTVLLVLLTVDFARANWVA